MDEKTRMMLNEITSSIQEAGLEPYDQIVGYLRTGNDRYITRTGNARERIKEIDRKILKQYTSYLKAKE